MFILVQGNTDKYNYLFGLQSWDWTLTSINSYIVYILDPRDDLYLLPIQPKKGLANGSSGMQLIYYLPFATNHRSLVSL